MPLQDVRNRLEIISDRQFAHELQTAARFWELRQRIADVERRAMTQRQRGKTRVQDTLGFLATVASFKTWIIGGCLLLLALKGSLSASEWKSILLSLIGTGSNG